MGLHDVLSSPKEFYYNGDESWGGFLKKAKKYLRENGGVILARSDYDTDMETWLLRPRQRERLVRLTIEKLAKK